MKVSSSSIVRMAIVAWATACPALAAPPQLVNGNESAGTAATTRTPVTSARHETAKSQVPLAPPNPIPISSLPLPITAPGYYRLTQDLTGSAGDDGITVSAPNVVVDLNGFTMSGVPGSVNGIVGQNFVTVLNGAVVGWGQRGIWTAVSTRLFDLEITNNGSDGALVHGQSLVQDCSLRSNGGNGLAGSSVVTVIDTVAAWNDGDGINAGGDCRIVDCLVANNGDDGIELGERSQVIGCNLVDNGSAGVDAKERTHVTDSTATGNDASGFLVGASSRIERCFAHDNFNGIHADEACLIVDCATTSNALHGITALESSLIQRCIVRANQRGVILFQQGCRVSDCKIEGNVDDGLVVSGNTAVERNSVQGNGSRGITAGSSGNRIDGNDLADNGTGIAVLSGNNLIVRNTLAFNAVQMQIAADNQQGPFIKAKGFIQNTNPWANFDMSFPTTFP